MVTYYRGPYAVVTSDVFEVRCPLHHRYPVHELLEVAVVRGAADPVAVGATGLGGAATVGVAASWPYLHTPLAWIGVVALVLLLAAIGAACWRLRPPGQELWAIYRGQRVQLFACRDSRVFGQVSRALLRALEASRAW